MIIYCDGACATFNGKCGGIAILPVSPGGQRGRMYARHYCDTTSQRMELEALLEALGYDGVHTIITDSKYAVEGFRGKWRLKANLDLWERIFATAADRNIRVVFSGRNSNEFQIAVDEVAKRACRACPKRLDKDPK